LYVLEVNAQCGLSEDEDYTSIGAILRFAGRSFTQLIEEIIYDTIANRGITR
jgi:D-alanine-D-alanine ligase